MAEYHEGDLRTVGNVLQIFTNDAWFDFRVTSDYEQGRADMLNEVIEWIRSYPRIGEACPIYDFDTESDRSLLIEDLKKAMRPQQQEKTDNTTQDTELVQRAMRYWEDK